MLANEFFLWPRSPFAIETSGADYVPRLVGKSSTHYLSDAAEERDHAYIATGQKDMRDCIHQWGDLIDECITV